MRYPYKGQATGETIDPGANYTRVPYNGTTNDTCVEQWDEPDRVVLNGFLLVES